MLFNSFQFLIFFPIVVILYFLMPKKFQWIWLLITSYYFYMGWNPKYAILLFTTTFITWICGLFISKAENVSNEKKKILIKKICIAISLCLNLAILFIFKYFDFGIDLINSALKHTNFELLDVKFDVILPVGISFYTFQALGYTVDVYRGDVKAEKNLARYALFVSFFPQLASGPIGRAKDLMKQMSVSHSFDYNRVKTGVLIMLWGLFQKIIIADRVCILVNQVFNNYHDYYGFEILIAVVLFAIQIYCDFAGYSDMAIGAAYVMGFDLIKNFDKPYFAISIKDFWRRWHISLSSWFRDYLYIPLGGNRKGKFRKNINLMIVFLVSGLWHGANITYVIWGAIHGIYQVIGDWMQPIKNMTDKIYKTEEDKKIHKLLKQVTTFALVDFAWIFFRADNLSMAVGVIKHMFLVFNPWVFFDETLFTLGLDRKNFQLMIIAILILFLIDRVRGKGIIQWIERQNIIVRWGIYYAAIFGLLIFGVYGPLYDVSRFLYFQF